MGIPEPQTLEEAKHNFRLSQFVQDQQTTALVGYCDMWSKACQVVIAIAYGTAHRPLMRDVGGGVRIVFGPPEYEHVLFFEAEGEEYMIYYSVIRDSTLERGRSFPFGDEESYADVRSRLPEEVYAEDARHIPTE